MFRTKCFRMLGWSLATISLSMANPAHAALVTYHAYGTLALTDSPSNVIDNPTGQSLVSQLLGKYAAFSLTVDTEVKDYTSDPDIYELSNAVPFGTANIGGIEFLQEHNSCTVNPVFDCIVSSKNNLGGSPIDLQIISSPLLRDYTLNNLAGTSMAIRFETVGKSLFVTPEIVDPFSGELFVTANLLYIHDNQMKLAQFELTNITATPVPEPSSSAMFGAALFLGALRLKKRLTA